MGAAPSRETHSRGLFIVNQGLGNSGLTSTCNKQDIVLIPLTKRFFPSPDCPLFVQFHEARCDPTVNYYLRQPGDPGNFSRIPNPTRFNRSPDEGEEGLPVCSRKCRRAYYSTVAAQAPHGVSMPCCFEANQCKVPSICPCVVADDDVTTFSERNEKTLRSRETLYCEVVERVEETLFDTDAEMREAHVWSQMHPSADFRQDGGKRRKVRPTLCAVAFRCDPCGTSPHPCGSSTHMADAAGVAHPFQEIRENGVYLLGSVVNVIGCFGFISVNEEMVVEREKTVLLPRNTTDTQSSVIPSVVSPWLTSELSQGSPEVPLGVGSEQCKLCCSASIYRHQPYLLRDSEPSRPPFSSSAGCTVVGCGSYLNCASNERASAAANGKTSSIGSEPTESLPTVETPLTAMMYVTKSAGEQLLGRVTFIAASMYYFQMVEAGIILRDGERSASCWGARVPSQTPSDPLHPAYWRCGGDSFCRSSKTSCVECNQAPGGICVTCASQEQRSPSLCPAPFPPMESFSFSCLMTNIPFLSFLYEMKYRWSYLKVLNGGDASDESNCCDGMVSTEWSGDSIAQAFTELECCNHAAQDTRGIGALEDPENRKPQSSADGMQMWITDDNMLHGRISKELAEHLCWSLVVQPEVMQLRVLHLPSEDEGYWRYRGLVDRTHPPPLPFVGQEVVIHPMDVYVMGKDALPDFDEGSVVRFDASRGVWYADDSIPLEGIVLAAMRPFCKQARGAPPGDPHWATRHIVADADEKIREGGVPLCPLPAGCTSNGTLSRVHDHVGNFFVYRFKRDGKTYYHGTVPNFANPRKNRPLHHVSPTNTFGVSSRYVNHYMRNVRVPFFHSRPLTVTALSFSNANYEAAFANVLMYNPLDEALPKVRRKVHPPCRPRYIHHTLASNRWIANMYH